LEALNPASQRTIEKPKIHIKKFPFRIGRSGLNQESDILQRNDLSLMNIDPGQVAKNHISIEKEDGEIRIRDRNTRRGTLVNGKHLHQESGDLVCSLNLGKNEIVLGDYNSNAAYSLTIIKI
jgi:pSer/pThr/pTyr-binding forkhead associated (FHA) protein